MSTTNDVFEVTNPELLERVQGINNGTIKDIVTSGQSQEIASQVTDTLSGGELATVIDGNYEVPINDGTVNFMHYEGTSFVDAPVTSTTAIQRSTPAGPISQYNSNVTAIQRGRVVQPYNASVADGKVTLSSTPASGSFGANAAYFLGEVNQAVCAAQVGIILGKTFDSALYNAMPDIWDSIGMSTLNPETWNSITHGDDSIGASLFNMIFGLNPDTNKGQAYIDQNALAYMAYYMYMSGVFDISGIDFPDKPTTGSYTANSSINIMTLITKALNACKAYNPVNLPIYDQIDYTALGNLINTLGDGFGFVNYNIPKTSTVFGGGITVMWFSTTLPYTNYATSNIIYSGFSIGWAYNYNVANRGSYFTGPSTVSNSPYSYSRSIGSSESETTTQYMYTYGTVNATESQAIEGIGNQEGATQPDTTGWDNLNDVLSSLQNQYPNIFNNSITYNQIQPDGSLKPTTYVPVGYPNTSANPWTDTQPTTTNQTTTQTNPQIDLDDLPNTETSPLTRTLTQTPTQNPNPDTDVPQNPKDTGDGSTPVPTTPTGEASALWSVYHPTQSQINSFGAWLWGSPFLTNIGKLFQNPIDGVISLHKIFATPVDSGSGNIVVGTLDSGVSSATVNQQYVTVDCGYVDCHEDFGNVFDYPPFTQVSIYLPFIGIVPLDVNDVMRSTIHVIYGVDVYTGACLAMIEVTRDGATVNMYQHSGVASVEYPLSNVQNSQMLSGLLMIAGGIASVAITGGASAPAAAGAVSASIGGVTSTMKSNVGKSGGFSGNAGAMGIKKPYLIIQRPQTKVAETFPLLEGYPTNYSCKLGDCSNHVVVKSVHVEGIPATDTELAQIETLLKDGVLI